MEIYNSYCRLCAAFKPANKQIDLDCDHMKKSDVIQKLLRINAAIDFESSLPKTLCFDCINALNKAYKFVITVECAQVALIDTFSLVKVKKENDIPAYEDHLMSDFEDNKLSFKVESISQNSNDIQDFNVDCDNEIKIVNIKKSNKKVDIDIDSIPLSQLSKQKLTWLTYNWICRHCDTNFSNIDELQTHAMQYHKVCNPYRCADCKTRKFRLETFIFHVQSHHNHLKLSCYKCFQHFDRAGLTKHHIKTVHLSANTCPGCHSSFNNEDDLKEHTDVYTQKALWKPAPIPEPLKMKTLTCNVCQKVFKSKIAVTAHLLTHTDRKKDNTCEICGKGFYSKYNLKYHTLLHTDVRQFKCEICNTAFKTKRMLKTHVLTHNDARPFSCDQCGRNFRLKKQLKSHSIIHTDIHPYPCPQCDKRFRFKSILNNHLRIHTGARPYTCEVCDKNFTNWPNYNKHMKLKHNMDKSKKKRTPDGVYPIDPKTGDIIKSEETKEIIEWKKNIMSCKSKGRPRL